MAQFLITYDNKRPRNYDGLYQLMAAWNAVRLAESVWLANLFVPADKVRAFVIGTMQRDDLVAVIELKPGSDWATLNASATANAWLSGNVTPSQKAA